MSETTHQLGHLPGIPAGQGMIGYFANNPVAANLMMALMLLGGLLAGLRLTAQIFPTVDPGQIRVTVTYPGATPTEVEEGITRRVEESIFGIDGIDRVLSTASENLGTVTAELKDFVDAMRVRDDIEAAVDRLADFPPEDAEQADIVRAETLSDVMSLVVSTELPEIELMRGAELLEEALLALPTVSLVSMLGARDYEIAIEVPRRGPQALRPVRRAGRQRRAPVLAEPRLRRTAHRSRRPAAQDEHQARTRRRVPGHRAARPARWVHPSPRRCGVHPRRLRRHRPHQRIQRPAERLRARAEIRSRGCPADSPTRSRPCSPTSSHRPASTSRSGTIRPRSSKTASTCWSATASSDSRWCSCSFSSCSTCA